MGMYITHYLNTQADDPSRARISSATNRTPVAFPPFIFGDTKLHDWRFVTSSGAVDSATIAAGNTLRVSLGEVDSAPWGGAFSLTCGETTDAIQFDATADEIETRLNNLDTVAASGGVVVLEGSRPGRFLVSWKTSGSKPDITGSATALIPQSGIAINTIVSGSSTANQLISIEIRRSQLLVQDYWSHTSYGWSGRLTVNTPACLEELSVKGEVAGEYIQISTTLTIEVVDSTSRPTTIYQGAVILRAKALAIESLTDSPMSSILTGTVALENYVQNRTGITGLSSLAHDNTKLGGLDTADGEMPTGANVLCKFTGDVAAMFELVAGTDTESSPWVLHPWDYDASTNARIWVLRSVHKQGVPCTWNADTARFHQLLAGGAAGSVYAAVDQTGFSLPE